MKKPVFKKWWFWVAIILVIGAIGSLNKKEEEADKTVTTGEVASNTEKKAPADSEPVKEKAAAKLPDYEIVEDDLRDTGMWYLTMSTASKDKAELEQLVRHAAQLAFEKDGKVQSAFVYIVAKDSTSSAYIATGKMAFTNKGLAQTGLSETGEVEFEFKHK